MPIKDQEKFIAVIRRLGDNPHYELVHNLWRMGLVRLNKPQTDYNGNHRFPENFAIVTGDSRGQTLYKTVVNTPDFKELEREHARLLVNPSEALEIKIVIIRGTSDLVEKYSSPKVI